MLSTGKGENENQTSSCVTRCAHGRDFVLSSDDDVRTFVLAKCEEAAGLFSTDRRCIIWYSEYVVVFLSHGRGVMGCDSN
jgi:hypothetical protein